MNRTHFSSFHACLLHAALLAQAPEAADPLPRPPHLDRRPHADGPAADAAMQSVRGMPIGQVFAGTAEDGTPIALGRTWKASFARDGVTFVPFFGPTAPRNYPVQLRVEAVFVGGQAVPFAAHAAPVWSDNQVIVDRGSLREHYRLDLESIEQTFVIDTPLAGDVELELAVATELMEVAASPGLQFANESGQVEYGEAFLVRGAEKLAIASAWTGRSILFRVPAALRDGGPVIIDPIVSSHTATYHPFPDPTSDCDVAYDLTFDRYCVVWESTFSANDHDVLCQMFDGAGIAIANSGQVLDVALSSFHARPRVANANSVNRFLIVMEAGGTTGSSIVARSREAGGTWAVGNPFVISAGTGGNDYIPDVGGDPGTTTPATAWLVVWTNVQSASDYNVYGCRVTGTPSPGPGFLIAGASGIHTEAAVSKSNWGGPLAPGWLVVWTFLAAPTDGNILARRVTGTAMGPQVTVTNSTLDHRYPNVSSPARDLAGDYHFMITFERQGTFVSTARVYSAATDSVTPGQDLSVFGIGPYWVRAESDGTRFAVTASPTSGLGTLHVATLAYANGSIVLHEPPQALGTLLRFPQITSKRSSGGPSTEYAVVTNQVTPTFDGVRLTLYDGHAPGPMIDRRFLACNGLGSSATGSTVLGNSVQFGLTNYGAALPGFGFGAPTVNPINICPSCALGLRLDLPIILIANAPWTLAIPLNANLVGSVVSVQGFALGGGTCLGSLSLSDAFDLTIR